MPSLGDIQDVLRPVADNVHPTDMSHTVIDNACAAGGSDTLTKRLRQAVAPELVALGPQTSDLGYRDKNQRDQLYRCDSLAECGQNPRPRPLDEDDGRARRQ